MFELYIYILEQPELIQGKREIFPLVLKKLKKQRKKICECRLNLKDKKKKNKFHKLFNKKKSKNNFTNNY